MIEQVTRALCRWCHADCRVAVHSENGNLVKIAQDRTDPRVDTILPPTLPPCNIACPANLDVLGYVGLIAKGKYQEALKLIKYDVPFPGIIGRICNYPCEAACDRADFDEPVSICALKRFVADNVKEEPAPMVKARPEKVAIVGSGPAGLSCAYFLARQGYPVTIFEASPMVGGMLNCIPEYRLPRDVLAKELKRVTDLGVTIRTNSPINQDLTLDDLFRQGFKAVFIGVGAQRVKSLPVEGAELAGVHKALELLHARVAGKIPADLFKGKKVIVIGGGEGGIDAARTSLRMGAKEVQLFCLESKDEMPAFKHDIKAAIDEGIIINNCWGPARFVGQNGKVAGVEFVGCSSVLDSCGKFAPTYDKSRTTDCSGDAVVIAIGQSADLSFLGKNSGIEINPGGTIKVDPVSLATTKTGVFVGGDVQTGPASAIEAIAAGKRAAVSVERFLLGMDLRADRTAARGQPGKYPAYTSLLKEFAPRQKMPTISLAKRRKSFAEVEAGFTKAVALKEASRCLACGCPRRAAAKEYIYHTDRLRFPLKRVGERGENKWEQITWEQALDEIAARLKELKGRYGAETLFLTHGTARSTSWTGPRFMNLFGSPNVVSPGTICYGPSVGVSAAMVGWPIIYRGDATIDPDEQGNQVTKCALFSGMDLSQAYPRLWKTAHDAKAAGTKIIVIDPRRTPTVELADIWLQLRPGTDTALLMSMINVIIEMGLYDKEFVNKWCYGFDKVRERAREYPLEKATEITWVPADKIKGAAIMYATNRPGLSVHGMGEEQLENSIAVLQARIILAAICGNIDVEGGDYVTGVPAGKATPLGAPGLELASMLSPEQKAKQIGSDRFKFLSHPGRELVWSYNKSMWSGQAQLRAYANWPLLIQAILTGKPYPVRAGITVFSNPMVQMSNSKHVYKALKSLDLYVVKDFWLTPSAQLADYVLPSAAWIERPNAEPFGGSVDLIAGEAALPATAPGEHEYWTEWEFFRGLGIKLGQENYWKQETLEEIYDERLSPLGMTLREFMNQKEGLFFPKREYKKYEQMGGFATPSGKLELYSNIFEKLGYDPLPAYEEPKESLFSTPELAKEYPLMLITGGRIHPYYHSEHRQIESARKRRPNPIVQINPETAKKLGIEDGDWAWIESPRGTIRMKCEYFDGIHPQVVHCEHAWWLPEMPGGEPWLRGVWESNVNVLTSDDPDRCNPMSGGWPLKTALCRVYKIKQY